MQNGVRLTCPLCKDSGWYSQDYLAAGGGKVYCDNHNNWVEMVNLADLLEIWGFPIDHIVLEQELPVLDEEAVESMEVHPDDFDFIFEDSYLA